MKLVLVFFMMAAATHGTVIGPKVSDDGRVITGAKVQLNGDGSGQSVITPDTIAYIKVCVQEHQKLQKDDGTSDGVITGPQTSVSGGKKGNPSTQNRVLSSKDGVMTMTGPQGTLSMNK